MHQCNFLNTSSVIIFVCFPRCWYGYRWNNLQFTLFPADSFLCALMLLNLTGSASKLKTSCPSSKTQAVGLRMIKSSRMMEMKRKWWIKEQLSCIPWFVLYCVASWGENSIVGDFLVIFSMYGSKSRWNWTPCLPMAQNPGKLVVQPAKKIQVFLVKSEPYILVGIQCRVQWGSDKFVTLYFTHV